MKQKENKGEKMLSTDTHTSSRLPNVEIERRVAKCGELRYKSDNPIRQTQWVDYCKLNYGDKSVPTYITYWMKAKEEYEDEWKGKLEQLLVPAQQHLRQLLEDPDPKVRSDAIKMVMKYSGNDIQKHLVRQEITTVSFGE